MSTRTTAEILIKTSGIHTACIVSYAHLCSLRTLSSSTFLSWDHLYIVAGYIFWPLYYPLEVLLRTIGLLWKPPRTTGWKFFTCAALGCRAEITGNPDNQPIPLFDNRGVLFTELPRDSSHGLCAWRTLPIIIFTTYAIITVVLGSRRPAGASLGLDAKNFSMALSGSFVGLCLLLLTAFNCVWSAPADTPPWRVPAPGRRRGYSFRTAPGVVAIGLLCEILEHQLVPSPCPEWMGMPERWTGSKNWMVVQCVVVPVLLALLNLSNSRGWTRHVDVRSWMTLVLGTRVVVMWVGWGFMLAETVLVQRKGGRSVCGGEMVKGWDWKDPIAEKVPAF